jgi:hypothetical protein
MDGIRFDRLARTIGARATRRAALLALAGAGLGGALGVAGLDEAAAKCSAKKPCGSCATCKKGKCKAKPGGTVCADGGGTCKKKACVCPNDSWLCPPAALCCPNGKTCSPTHASCGACPPGNDVCNPDGFTVCGSTTANDSGFCGCVTSVENTSVCTSFAGHCFACTTDQACSDELGVAAICIASLCNCSEETACVVAACDSAGVTRSGAKWRPLAQPKVAQAGA